MPRHKWAIKIKTFHCDCKRSCYPKKVSLPSAAVKLLTYPDIEQSCVGLGSSWDPATSPIQPETPGARPSSRPWLPRQLPFVGTSDVERWIRGIDQLIGGTRESSPAPGSLSREKKYQHIRWKRQFTSFIGFGCLSEPILSQNSIYNLHIFQTPPPSPTHTHSSCTERYISHFDNMFYKTEHVLSKSTIM